MFFAQQGQTVTYQIDSELIQCVIDNTNML